MRGAFASWTCPPTLRGLRRERLPMERITSASRAHHERITSASRAHHERIKKRGLSEGVGKQRAARDFAWQAEDGTLTHLERGVATEVPEDHLVVLPMKIKASFHTSSRRCVKCVEGLQRNTTCHVLLWWSLGVTSNVCMADAWLMPGPCGGH